MVSKPQLCLYIHAGASDAALRQILDLHEVASVIIEAPCATATDQCALIQTAQSHGAAALLLNDPIRARELNADGVHLAGYNDPQEELQAVRRQLGSDRIIGIEAPPTRHDAMVLGELGADYLAFPVSDAEGLERLAWWVELFEVPAIAFRCSNADQLAKAVTTGAEFVAFDVCGQQNNAYGDDERSATLFAAYRALDVIG